MGKKISLPFYFLFSYFGRCAFASSQMKFLPVVGGLRGQTAQQSIFLRSVHIGNSWLLFTLLYLTTPIGFYTSRYRVDGSSSRSRMILIPTLAVGSGYFYIVAGFAAGLMVHTPPCCGAVVSDFIRPDWCGN